VDAMNECPQNFIAVRQLSEPNQLRWRVRQYVTVALLNCSREAILMASRVFKEVRQDGAAGVTGTACQHCQ
jgi:hypothetical protein